MGMFDKDKEIGYRIDVAFDLREDFILWDASIAPDLVPTSMGNARKTILEVSRMDEPDIHFECATLASAIADKAENAVPDEFPVVVQLQRVKGRFTKGEEDKALVLQFVRDYK